MSWIDRINSHVSTLSPYQAGKRLEDFEGEKGVGELAKLSSNESPYKPSEKVMAAMQDALDSLNYYPDPDARLLKHHLAQHYNIDEDGIIVGSGSNELLDLIASTLLNPGDEVVYPWPSFVVYRSMVKRMGAKSIEVPLNKKDEVDLDALVASVTPNTKLVLICNPNNPTSTALSEAKIAEAIKRIPEDVVVVVDEAYIELADPSVTSSMIEYCAHDDRLVVLRTFSKAYGLAGIRIGWGLCSPQFSRYLNAVRAPFNVNSVAQAAAIAALEDTEELQFRQKENAELRELLQQALDELHIYHPQSQTNFIWIPLEDSERIEKELLYKGFIMRRFPNGVRITIGNREETERLVGVLQEVFSS